MSPRYVEYGSLMTPPAPFRSLRTRLHGFWASASHRRLKELCRRVFFEPADGELEFHPLGKYVMLTWGDIEQVLSETPPHNSRGGVREPQVAVWVPVVEVRRVLGAPVAARFAMFMPYIWLDNAMSLATGREVFGYPKAWGWPTFPQQGQEPSWTLDVFGLNYGPDQQAGRHPLLEIAAGPTLSEPEEVELEGLADVARHAAGQLFDGLGAEGVLPGLELGPSLVADLLAGKLANVFLKQFRSCEDGLEACLQQVVEARYRVLRLRAAPLTRTHQLTVHPLDSHPVVTELGLESGPIRVAYRVEMDFLVGEGRVLWDAADVA